MISLICGEVRFSNAFSCVFSCWPIVENEPQERGTQPIGFQRRSAKKILNPRTHIRISYGLSVYESTLETEFRRNIFQFVFDWCRALECSLDRRIYASTPHIHTHTHVLQVFLINRTKLLKNGSRRHIPIPLRLLLFFHPCNGLCVYGQKWSSRYGCCWRWARKYYRPISRIHSLGEQFARERVEMCVCVCGEKTSKRLIKFSRRNKIKKNEKVIEINTDTLRL